MTALITAVVTTIGGLLAALPGPIAQAITGGQSAEAAIAAGMAAAKAIAEREAVGSDTTAGAWDLDVEARKARGES
jgi:hypothetical protein